MTTAPQLEAVEDTEYDEPADAALRKHLGLRPTYYEDAGSPKSPHPDQHPCPSWCWVGQSQGEYEHEIAYDNPTMATHTMEGSPHVLASCYRGYSWGDGGVHTASIEPHLEQVGTSAAQIRVYLRFGTRDRDERTAFEERLRLRIEDARELVVALSHLIEVADAG